MTEPADAVLLIDHSAELGGGELSLFDYARSTPRAVRVLVFEPGPFVDLLARTGIPVAVIAAGAMLGVRRDNGLRKGLAIVPSLVRSIAALGRAMRQAPVVYANSQKALVAAALANVTVRRPLIWHLHDIMTAAHFSGLMRRVAIGLSNRFVTHVIANSQATEASYRVAGGTRPVTVVHNGIDPGPFQGIDRVARRNALVRDLGVPDNMDGKPIIAVFGRLSAWKGQDIAITAIAAVPDVRLVLVGSAMFGDGAFEATLREQMRTSGVEDRVHFLGFREDIAPLMAAVDVIVHASTAPEPFGRVIVEAMMAGTPVIATAAGGAVEIVDDSISGLLVPPGEPMALAAAIRRLIADPEATAALAMRGREVAETRFSLAAAVRRTDAVIDLVSASVRQPA